jgi:chromosome partitioning protein
MRTSPSTRRGRHRAGQPSRKTLIVVLCNEKGGVGKSTLVLGLAAMASMMGYLVLVVDADPQGTVRDASRAIEDPGYMVAEETDPAVLGRLRDARDPATGRPFDLILVDTPGNLTTTEILNQVLEHADLALVPFDATWVSVKETLRTVEHARAAAAEAVVVLNNIDRYSDEVGARQQLRDLNVPCLRGRVVSHIAHQNATRDGYSISSYPGGEYAQKSRDDLKTVLNETMEVAAG